MIPINFCVSWACKAGTDWKTGRLRAILIYFTRPPVANPNLSVQMFPKEVRAEGSPSAHDRANGQAPCTARQRANAHGGGGDGGQEYHFLLSNAPMVAGVSLALIRPLLSRRLIMPRRRGLVLVNVWLRV